MKGGGGFRLGTVVRRSKATVSGCRSRSLTFLVRSDSTSRRQLSVGISSQPVRLKSELRWSSCNTPSLIVLSHNATRQSD